MEMIASLNARKWNIASAGQNITGRWALDARPTNAGEEFYRFECGCRAHGETLAEALQMVTLSVDAFEARVAAYRAEQEAWSDQDKLSRLLPGTQVLVDFDRVAKEQEWARKQECEIEYTDEDRNLSAFSAALADSGCIWSHVVGVDGDRCILKLYQPFQSPLDISSIQYSIPAKFVRPSPMIALPAGAKGVSHAETV